MNRYFRYSVIAWLSTVVLLASEQDGQVTFNGLPVPGATVTATQSGKKFTAITDSQGVYSFPDLPDGVWTIQVEMQAFSTIKQDVTVAAGAPSPTWQLKLMPLNEIKAQIAAPPVAAPNTTGLATRPQADNTAQKDTEPVENQDAGDLSQKAADGFLINGTQNNGASSPFALNPAFGNNRRGPRSLYNGNLGLILDNSLLDARSFSLTGQDTPKPAYNDLQGVVAFGGPIRIPHLLRDGPNLFVGYQRIRDSTATTQTGLMPTEDERRGILPGITIPASQISPQAIALLKLYPLPNFQGNSSYNYQVPVVGAMHQDNLQTRLNKTASRTDQFSGVFALQSTRSDNPNLFGFLDTGSTLGINAAVNWRHSFTPRFFANFGYQFSRLAVRVTPYFANRQNISGDAGITGNSQNPADWGPPALIFSSGITGLSDALPSFNRNQTGALSYGSLWSHRNHNVSFGADYRRQQFNVLSQQDPRGAFTFNGANDYSDFAQFLLGVPDTSSIAFGNADKYLRDSSYDAYITDDWRMNPGFTLNAGVRWEYWSPITELYGRLVNLDIAPGFTAAAPVVANDPVGTLTGHAYPDSLIQPDTNAFQPRIGFSWRPFSASSMVVRGGYGVYYNTSIYQSIAMQMAQQSPLSNSLSVQNSLANPLTLANGFNTSPGITPNTFAVDPDFRVGYAQNWQLSIQRDLPASLQVTATYLGIKGTRGVQEFLPNTYPKGAVNPCPLCPSGFVYMTSNGNSTREAGQIQLRRRLHNGFTATVEYTFSKSIDDDSVIGGGSQGTPALSQNGVSTASQAGVSTGAAPTSQSNALIAQNWLNLSAERSLSNFDQRHLLNLQMQYTTGMGLHGGTLLSGWKGALLKEWTFLTDLMAGSGLPLTPVYPVAIRGTGVTGPVRPDYTGASVHAAPSGLFLNPAAYAAPATGQWGNAARNSITGPSQFALNASLGRTFRMSDRINLDVRVDSTNVLNHVTFPSWNTTIGSAQFGLPNQANAMRTMQTTIRLRF